MHPFVEKVFYLLVWRAILAGLMAFALIAWRNFEFAGAFLIGANTALLFSIGLLAWKSHLNEERIIRIEAWRTLSPRQRPAGQAGRRWAFNHLEELTLRFAQASSAVAIALAGTALAMSAD